MATSVQVIEGDMREGKGKGPSRELRRNGRIPAVIYGKGRENVNISLNAKEMNQRLHKVGFMSQLFDIKVGKQSYLALPSDYQLHPVTDVLEHIDFIHVSENSEVKVHVKIQFLNQDKSIGIKRGGVINIARREIELVCKPKDIPTFIEIDLANLDIGNAIHINDVVLPKGTKFAGNENVTIAVIVGRSEESETPAQQPAASS